MKSIVSWDEMNNGRADDGYDELLVSIKKTFREVVEQNEPLFITSSPFGLYDLFLLNLPEEARQHYNCRTCRSFVERFGGIVWIDKKTWKTESALWSADEDEIPPFFANAVHAVRDKVLHDPVIGVLVSDRTELGSAHTGSWLHMSVSLPDRYLNSDPVQNARQVYAEKREEYEMLNGFVRKYSRNSMDVVEKAIFYLDSGKFYRGEKFVHEANWFLDILKVLPETRQWKNVIWRNVATAPTGYCHIGNGVLGALIDDIAAGLDYEDVKARYEDKMDPLKYQRPQEAPAAGNVQQAEELVSKLGLADALERRFARLDEIPAIWRPSLSDDSAPSGGIFGKLKTKKTRKWLSKKAPVSGVSMDDVITMTWEKFRRKVLPGAESIEYFVPEASTSYAAIVTAKNPYAPPIIKWDLPEKRNPASWYVYSNGSAPERWNLHPGTFVRVNAVTLQPNLWNDEHTDYGNGYGVFFILDGARDLQTEHTGAALFPEVLNPALRPVRATIEAYSQTAKLHEAEMASACGLRLQFGCDYDVLLRVKTELCTACYRIDRWD